MSRALEEYQKIAETPHASKNESIHSFRSSYDSLDSGYLSFTLHSSNHGSSRRSKLSLTSARSLCRSQNKPYLYKVNRKLNISESLVYNSSDALVCSPKSPDERLTSTLSSSSDDSRVYYPRSHRMELRSHKRRQQQSASSLAGIVRNYNFRGILSSPPLPTVPSPFANKPTENNEESKLVIPQSTPCVSSFPTLPHSNTPLYNVALSPINYKTSPTTVSVYHKKFSNLSISEHVSISINTKPKKLEFSKRAIFASFQKQRATPDCTGKETVDILKVLGIKSNHPEIVSRILSYLSSQDLCSVSMVSRSWQKLCGSDAKAEERRLKYIILKQCSKENFLSIRKSKLEEDVQMSPKSRYPRRGFLTAVPTNILQIPKIHLSPSSPPVSPSKVIFHSFVKAGRSLAPRDQLVPCPQCKFACRIKHEKNVGSCSRQGCPMGEFCILCSSKLHSGEPCKMPLLATPTKRGRHQQPIVGTKQCKRNLRRISRLI